MSQTYGVHDVASAGAHAPIPSQRIALENVVPEHVAVPHTTVALANAAQVFPSVPSQLFAAQGDEPASHAVRAPCGAPTTATQLPFDPVTSQASH